MARGGRAEITVNHDQVFKMLNVVMRNVERGTKKATEEACRDILDRSLELVPRDTEALASSAFMKIVSLGKGAGFAGVVGYGGNGDPVNPKSGLEVSKYMVTVHEDTEAHHDIGQAKYLEMAVLEYQKDALVKAGRTLESELR